jgi:hypothetical protein
VATSTTDTPATINSTVTVSNTPLLDVVASDIPITDTSAQGATTAIVLTPDPLPTIPMANVDMTPAPEFAFALTGNSMPTEKDDVPVTTALTSVVDNAHGVMRVSGKCSATYYVVLLFRHPDDYKKDPRSYVVNRAYPCEGGSFSYVISDLPEGLADGIYYLLIGEQGERGPWAPITEQTEVTIKNNR